MLQRRHCQQAASNDARRLHALVTCPAGIARESLSAIDIAVHARPRNAEGLCRVAQVRGTLSPQVERLATSKGCVHPRIVNVAGWRQTPGRDLLRSIELQRRVTTATPFGAYDRREGKEPREKFELTA